MSERARQLGLLRELREELGARGAFAPSTMGTIAHLAVWLAILGGGFAVMWRTAAGAGWAVAAVAAGLAFVQMGFVGHDAGHLALFRRRWVNDLVGRFAMTTLCGISFSHWRVSHNRHHRHCQEEAEDPDMQLGLLSVYEQSPAWHDPFARRLLPMQAWLFWPLTFLYFIEMRFDTFRNLVTRPDETRADRLFFALHFVALVIVPSLVFGWAGALAGYAASSSLGGALTAALFSSNHFGMPRVAAGGSMSYLEQQTTGSRNIDNHRAFDVFFGGLNAQIEHHLFPGIARLRLRAARPVVKAFCRRHGLPYREERFGAALAAVTGHLAAMSARFAAAERDQRS